MKPVSFTFYLFLTLSFNKFPFVASKVKCPDPRNECLLCPKCSEGYTLVKSPCGCCEDRCVKNHFCRCPLFRCPPRGVTVPGPEPCRCPTCVIPKPGDKCLEFDDGTLTCGSSLACCNGICQEITKPCEDIFCSCYEPICRNDSVGILVLGPEPCRCPTCVTPEPGDNCYRSLNETLTCGNLVCCNGVCQEEECETCHRPCPRPLCTPKSIHLTGPEPCRCPYCVEPKPGDECYYESSEGSLTCGETITNLTCCNGVCQDISKPCEESCVCSFIGCPDGVWVPGGCKCSICVIPGPGDKCLESTDGTISCGRNLNCCDGICQENWKPCGEVCSCPSKPDCSSESIEVYGPEPCRCLGCVEPEPGDKCYHSLDGTPFCGEERTNLTCCNGLCEDISAPCEFCNCPLKKCSASAGIVPGPEPCRCRDCVVPEPGDKCLETVEGYLTCGADLVCCDGVCQKDGASCKEICNCPLVDCIPGSVPVPGREPCKCPTCILPDAQ